MWEEVLEAHSDDILREFAAPAGDQEEAGDEGEDAGEGSAAEDPAAPVVKQKIKELEVLLIEPLLHIRDFRQWRLWGALRDEELQVSLAHAALLGQ